MKSIITSILLAVFSIGIVTAQNPHLVSGPTFTDNGVTLTATGSIAGVGNNQFAVVTVTATVYVTTICTNPGGNVVPGQSGAKTIQFSGKYKSDANGRINFSVTSDLQKPGLCPNGNWRGEVTDVSFSNLKILLNGTTIY
jgi:hypothetical protein